MDASTAPLQTSSPPSTMQETHSHHSPTPIFCTLIIFALLSTCIYLTLILIKKLAHLRNDWGYWTGMGDEEKHVGFEYSEELRRAVERRRELAKARGEGGDVGLVNEDGEEEREKRRLERIRDRVRAGYDGFRGN
ncbi:hypothetical protein BGZ60DRAFT_532625 [Tricladium varicosporioides]|nr:hypothetical protein BGZ60DRAFT_532625 [Hymenoscyphus varicosporioides]